MFKKCLSPTDSIIAILGSSGGSTINSDLSAMSERVGQTASELRVAASSAINDLLSTEEGRRAIEGATVSDGDSLEGLRNSLFLKYVGIDYEFFNSFNMRYRGPV